MNSFIIQIDGSDLYSSQDWNEAKELYNAVDDICLFSDDGKPKTLVARICGEDHIIKKDIIEKSPEQIMAHRTDAVVIMSSGRIKTLPHYGEKFELKDLQTRVDGYIEIVPLDGGTVMVVNEDGKNNGLPFNPRATGVFQKYNHTGDYIVGDVVLCYSEDIQ